jgi:hypothetical protein
MREGTTGITILQELKDKYGMACYLAEIDGKQTLYVGLAYDLRKGNVKHVLNRNTTNSSELKYNTGEDKKYKVKVTVFAKNGTQKDYEIGDKEGELRTVFLYGDHDQKSAEHFAASEMETFKAHGYKGSIETFLIPYCEPGMISKLSDPQFAERSGNYYIGTVVTTINTSGARRKPEVEVRLSV